MAIENTENDPYSMAYQEMVCEEYYLPIWSRVFAESGGNIEKAKADYVKSRAVFLEKKNKGNYAPNIITRIWDFISQYWLGKFTLGESLGLFFMLNILVGIYDRVSSRALLKANTDFPIEYYLITLVLFSALFIWQFVGLFRSALYHKSGWGLFVMVGLVFYGFGVGWVILNIIMYVP